MRIQIKTTTVHEITISDTGILIENHTPMDAHSWIRFANAAARDGYVVPLATLVHDASLVSRTIKAKEVSTP